MSKLQKTVKKHIKCSLAPSRGVFQVFYCDHQIRRTCLPLVRMFRFQSQNIHFGQKVHGAVPTHRAFPGSTFVLLGFSRMVARSNVSFLPNVSVLKISPPENSFRAYILFVFRKITTKMRNCLQYTFIV